MMDSALHLSAEPGVASATAGHRRADSDVAGSARVVATVRAGLDDLLQDTGPDIAERLRFSRERALARARLARLATATPAAGLVGWRGLAVAGVGGGSAPERTPWWGRLGFALPVAILVAGLMLIQQHLQNEEIRVAAEIDAALLADDLPPSAYADPGFLEFLRQGEPRGEPRPD